MLMRLICLFSFYLYVGECIENKDYSFISFETKLIGPFLNFLSPGEANDQWIVSVLVISEEKPDPLIIQNSVFLPNLIDTDEFIVKKFWRYIKS